VGYVFCIDRADLTTNVKLHVHYLMTFKLYSFRYKERGWYLIKGTTAALYELLHELIGSEMVDIVIRTKNYVLIYCETNHGRHVFIFNKECIYVL